MTVMDVRLAAKNKRQELAKVAEVAQGVAGARVSGMLDFLSSELVRLQGMKYLKSIKIVLLKLDYRV